MLLHSHCGGAPLAGTTTAAVRLGATKRAIAQIAFTVNGTLQALDDCAPVLTFEQANIYSDKKIKMGKERITRQIVLPNYRLTRSSKSFSLYERINS